MLQTPEPSPYDLRFPIMDFPVRVSWTFWLAAAAIGFNSSKGIDQFFSITGQGSPGTPLLLLIFIAVMFVSILIHELGHTLAFRYYGIDSQIVLYHFGGLAIPSAYSRVGSRAGRIGPKEQLVISAAGPVAQLILGSLVAAVCIKMGMEPGHLMGWLKGVGMDLNLELNDAPNAALYAFIDSTIYINFAWAVLNLLPVLPMDGGRIAQSLIALVRGGDGLYEASILSVGFGALVGLWMLKFGNPSLGILLLILGFSNVETLQRYGSRW